MKELIDLKQLNPAFVEALCIHEALRRLGYPAADIFVGQTEAQQLLVVLRHKDREFVIDVVPAGSWAVMPEAEFTETWQTAVAVWKAQALADAYEAYERSDIRKRSVELITLLTLRGLYPPE